jgi:hypothetical protein
MIYRHRDLQQAAGNVIEGFGRLRMDENIGALSSAPGAGKKQGYLRNPQHWH